MSQFETETDEEKEPGSDISVPMSIAELIAAREEIIESWAELKKALKRSEAAFSRIHDKTFRFHYDDSGRYKKYPFDRDGQTKALDYSLWEFALEKLNITNAMTGKAKDAFLESVKKKATPFIEHEIQGLAQNAHTLFRESSLNTVREVYRQLIGVGYNSGNSSLERKRDNLRKVEKVFRVGWSDLYVGGWGGVSKITYRHYNPGISNHFRFEDLITACRLIEGEGFSDYSNNLYSMLSDVTGCEFDAGWFRLTAYKNGNVKVNWNEDKIHVLDKLNAIGSGKSSDLPDAMRKRYKPEHFHGGGMPEAETLFAVNPDMKPSDEKDFAFYPTPPEVADRMVELAEYHEGADYDTLEPSAGHGSIAEYIPFSFGSALVEFNHHRADKLQERYPAFKIIEADFLKWETEEKFDRVLMNPPFNDRSEAHHIVKAFSHLKPGGILVAIMPEGWFTRDDVKSTVLRGWMKKHEHKPSEKLPGGTFGRTRIETRIVTLRKLE